MPATETGKKQTPESACKETIGRTTGKKSHYLLGMLIVLSWIFGIGIPAFADELSNVERIADGDTIDISRDRRVDLIGIDAPEASHSGKLYEEAKDYHLGIYQVMAMGKSSKLFLRSILQNREVRLEYDEQIRDKKKRQRAFVYLLLCKNKCEYQPVEGFEYIKLDDGIYIFVNATLLKSGYARLLESEPNPKYRDLFIRLEREAKDQGLGIWAPRVRKI
jgi:micrococcal nuclease